MPIYCYRCPNCGLCDEVNKPMSEANTSHECGNCESMMKRNFTAENVNTGVTEYATPLISDSLAMHPDLVKDHRKQFPDVKILDDGRPVFTNTQQHDKYLQKCGMGKIPKSKRKKARKVASIKQ